MNFVVAANASASMGWKLGFLAGSFAACRAFIRVQNPRILESLQVFGRLLISGGLLVSSMFCDDVIVASQRLDCFSDDC